MRLNVSYYIVIKRQKERNNKMYYFFFHPKKSNKPRVYGHVIITFNLKTYQIRNNCFNNGHGCI